MMKKALFTMAVLAMVGLMVSCQKDGVFSPKNKVSKIYREYQEIRDGQTVNSMSKTLYNVWNWQDDKLVSIDYMSGGQVSYTETYTYDGDHIVSAACTYEGSTEVFSNQVMTYDGSKLVKIEYFSRGTLTSTYTFTHKAGKIVQMDITYPEGTSDPYLDKSMPAMVRMMMPDMHTADIIERTASKAITYTYSMTYKFSYKGSNVSKIEIADIRTRTENNIEEVYTDTEIIEYSYDGKSNPFYELISSSGPQVLSKNNVLQASETSKTTRTENGELVQESNYLKPNVTDYTYTYEGDKPTVQTGTNTYTSGSTTYSYITTMYYEYL